MADIKDDPREVLALLNSLGFVGITAPQLKAFMKDLKMYRKMKELEKQQRKEEMRKKILHKQQNIIREMYKENLRESSKRTVGDTSSSSSNCLYSDSLVRVNIECVSHDRKEQQRIRQKHLSTNVDNLKEVTNVPELKNQKYTETEATKRDKSNGNVPKPHSDTKYPTRECKTDVRDSSASNRDRSTEKRNVHDGKTKESKRVTGIVKKDVTVTYKRPISAQSSSELEHKPRAKSRIDRSKENIRSHSLPSTRPSSSSGHKSFIRPWRLQPDAQRSMENRKSDPVALYQKYQEEWKKVAFPGDAKHAGVRWAIREKMLGSDPHPLPLPRKTVSVPSLKRK